ncbi:hypothetical protein GCM10009621_04720 [Corynebacterium felinum]|uniref:Non-ribosomal peptide synthetase component F n=1 Tax=Corynebacterium felinum TaxID=131318 RepID=A0ABU2B5H5_9CORY|nr:non-ribosomal peptide synthetase component F [Corynebacterium felinum]
MSIANVPSQYLLATQAPAKRTLIDILRASVDKHPEAAAIDDGEVITYAELWEEITAQAAHLHTLGIRRGDRIGIRMSSGRKDLYIAILATLTAGAAYVPVDADDPDERAELVFSEARINALYTDDGPQLIRATPGGDTRRPPAQQRRLDHLHLRLHRNPQRCCRHPPQRRRIRRRRIRTVSRQRTSRPARSG